MLLKTNIVWKIGARLQVARRIDRLDDAVERHSWLANASSTACLTPEQRSRSRPRRLATRKASVFMNNP